MSQSRTDEVQGVILMNEGVLTPDCMVAVERIFLQHVQFTF